MNTIPSHEWVGEQALSGDFYPYIPPICVCVCVCEWVKGHKAGECGPPAAPMVDTRTSLSLPPTAPLNPLRDNRTASFTLRTGRLGARADPLIQLADRYSTPCGSRLGCSPELACHPRVGDELRSRTLSGASIPAGD